jgi:hypothetical protein
MLVCSYSRLEGDLGAHRGRKDTLLLRNFTFSDLLIKFGLRVLRATSAVEQRPTGNLGLFLDEEFENELSFAKFLLVVGATVEKSRFSVAVTPFRSLNRTRISPWILQFPN